MKDNKTMKVLIALDYDPSAKKVAEAGFELSNSMDAEVVLLHVIADPIYYASPEYSPIMGFSGEMAVIPVQLDNEKGLQTASMQFLEKFKQHYGHGKTKCIVDEGDFATAILETAKKEHVSIIVMGSHSRSWLQNIVLGSVTEKVLHEISVPLYIIPIKKDK